ncbi:MAG: GNAT family N-acetyltransferase [Puniceicoccaceae bacterium]
MTQFVEIEFGSPLYKAELDLRDRLLRIPLGLDIRSDDLTTEQEYRHFGILQDNILVACLVAVPRDPGQMQLRQIAVEEYLQGKGIGRIIMQKAEAILAEAGVDCLVLNSRDTAVGFYQRLGYEPVGEGFVEVGIPHRRMEKRV